MKPKLWLAGTLNSTARNESAQTKSSKSWSISFRMQCEVNISKSKCKPKEAISKWSQWTGLWHSSDNAGTFFLSNRHPKTEMFDSLTGFVSECQTEKTINACGASLMTSDLIFHNHESDANQHAFPSKSPSFPGHVLQSGRSCCAILHTHHSFQSHLRVARCLAD